MRSFLTSLALLSVFSFVGCDSNPAGPAVKTGGPAVQSAPGAATAEEGGGGGTRKRRGKSAATEQPAKAD